MKRGLIIAAVVVALALLGVGGYFGGKAWLLAQPAGEGRGQVVVDIPRGSSVRAAAEILHRAGVLSRPLMLVAAARLTREAGPIHAGEYSLSAEQTIGGLLDDLRRGKVLLHTVALPEGLTMAEMIDRLAQAGVINGEKALTLAEDPAFARQLGLPGPNLEGYLFPETYHLAKGLGERRVLTELTDGFKGAWKEVEPRAAEQGLGMKQVAILASIIEKEARLPEERPLVSAVYHNRIKKGMRLDADPTVIYGLGGLERPLNRKDLRIDTPYNTYMHHGLPPGPICNPGLASIRAAVAPAPVDYLYFVAKGDGGHAFSETYAGQVRAINRYRRR